MEKSAQSAEKKNIKEFHFGDSLGTNWVNIFKLKRKWEAIRFFGVNYMYTFSLLQYRLIQYQHIMDSRSCLLRTSLTEISGISRITHKQQSQ